MKNTQLKYITREPNTIDQKSKLLIMLHGYGSNEEDLFSFAPELPDNLIIISVRAPLETGFGGYAWYSINFTADQSKFSDIPEARYSVSMLSTYIDEIKKQYGMDADNTFLLGFSQGTILSYAIALSFPQKVSNIIALSGYINPDLLPDNMDQTDYSNLDFYISHGTVDQVIPVQWAQQAAPFLKQFNIKHCYSEYPVGHGVAPQNFFAFKKWIEERS